MKVAVDTNVLARALLNDDRTQSKAAQALLSEAEAIIVPVAVFCELVWVLQGLEIDRQSIIASIEETIASSKVVTNSEAVEAGLLQLRSKGDFADGAIAMEGYLVGAETFATFDKKATRLLKEAGRSVIRPTTPKSASTAAPLSPPARRPSR